MVVVVGLSFIFSSFTLNFFGDFWLVRIFQHPPKMCRALTVQTHSNPAVILFFFFFFKKWGNIHFLFIHQKYSFGPFFLSLFVRDSGETEGYDPPVYSGLRGGHTLDWTLASYSSFFFYFLLLFMWRTKGPPSVRPSVRCIHMCVCSTTDQHGGERRRKDFPCREFA